MPAWLGKLMLRLNKMDVKDHNNGNWPAKCVVAVAPHTSNRDFPYGLYARAALGINIGFVGKSSLFKFPLGPILKSLGGVPVERSKSTNFVQSVANVFKSRDEFKLCLAIEGTRSKVDRFKTGFYYIAKEAGVPIILTKWDFGNRCIDFGAPFYPTDDAQADLEYIYQYFDGVKGIVPENSFEYDPKKAFEKHN